MREGDRIVIENEKSFITGNVVKWNYNYENDIHRETLNVQLTNINVNPKGELGEGFEDTNWYKLHVK